MTTEIKCGNCGKTWPESERASVGAGTKLMFVTTNIILTGVVPFTADLCRTCVRQRCILSGMVVFGAFVLLAFFVT
jgi:hypothetical protein